MMLLRFLRIFVVRNPFTLFLLPSQLSKRPQARINGCCHAGAPPCTFKSWQETSAEITHDGKRAALILTGLHYWQDQDRYHRPTKDVNARIDYRRSLRNYEEKILRYFLCREQYIAVDVYIATAHSNSKAMDRQLLVDYAPVKHIFGTSDTDVTMDSTNERPRRTRTAIAMIKDRIAEFGENYYERIVATRFDIIIYGTLQDAVWNKFNLVSRPYRRNNFIDDNFQALPSYLLDRFDLFLTKVGHGVCFMFHFCWRELVEAMGGTNKLNFMRDTHNLASNFTWFKLARDVHL